MYLNRIEAAQALQERLLRHKGEDGVVLAVPRGGSSRFSLRNNFMAREQQQAKPVHKLDIKRSCPNL
jgi:hypothetical protein